MRKLRAVPVAVAVLTLSACYHATVDTGRTPSGQTFERRWAHSFLGGLVPPETAEVASRCPNGVAKVETQLSFLNMVANVLTFGIYSPMDIRVQCAGAGASLDGQRILPGGATPAEHQAALSRAVEVSRATEAAVFVQF